MQLRHGLYLNDKTNTVASGPSLLALRLGGLSHALEPNRDYLLGSADDCDLRIAGAEPVHARLLVTAEGATFFDLSEAAGLLFNEEKVLQAAIRPGDRVGIAGELMVVTADDGTAALVPIPQLRQAAIARRIVKVRAAAAALRRQDDGTFAQLMAKELRRAPWVLLSLMLHLLLLLLRLRLLAGSA